MNREWIKINSLLNSLIKRIYNSKVTSDNYQTILRLAEYYVENYYFEREIETMAPLYSGDPDRLRNLRLKIIESFNDKKLIERLEGLKNEL